jgi:hypothetical protein
MPFEKIFAELAHAKVDKERPESVPIAIDELNLAAGVQVYRENCAVGHGLPGQTETGISEGMFPHHQIC